MTCERLLKPWTGPLLLLGEGLNLAVSRIDADLTVLDERVDRHR